VRRPLPAGGSVRGRTSAFERIARLPDYKLVDRLLRSRLSIWLIGIMLGGIVAMQVSLLKLNTGISNAIRTQQTLEHKNQVYKMQIAGLNSGELIRAKAGDMHMVDPAAGDNRYLKSRGVEKDAARAAKRYTPPSEKAKLVQANFGLMPGEGATLESLAADNAQLTNAGVLPGQTPDATAQATPTPVVPVATPEPLPTPVPTATPVPTVGAIDPATGLATAPE
jgi:hypothetical protein